MWSCDHQRAKHNESDTERPRRQLAKVGNVIDPSTTNVTERVGPERQDEQTSNYGERDSHLTIPLPPHERHFGPSGPVLVLGAVGL